MESSADINSVLQGKKALLADDMQLNQFVLGQILEQCGLLPVFARNGKEALQLASEQDFEFILLDVVMPELDGLEASRKIRQLIHSNAQKPIIAITANFFDSDMHRYQEAGITAILLKPVSKEQLEQVLLAVLSVHPDETPLRPIPTSANFKVNAAPVINLSYLEETGKGNPVFIASMLNNFCNTVTELVSQLEESLQEKQYTKTKELFHQLKFPLGVIGQQPLINDITKLEQESLLQEKPSTFKLDDQQVNNVLTIVRSLLSQAKELIASRK